jgi:ABC-type lipoprotein export system ATPase subunit/bifunctional DNA-binding transcriptional regulator/antitoxin component of YhaV-PrlF toxin-antitoxin module
MITCENVVKIYKTSETEVVALQGLDLEVPDGELMAIIGNSGSGKSTLLNILGGLDTPSAGEVIVAGTNMRRLDEKSIVDYRRDRIGFVWQNSARNLIPYLTALENVELPMQISGGRKRSWARELLAMVGLSHRERSRLDQLSGGEQQRVAIAIALANNPPLLLADEPTGAVDTETTAAIMDVFRLFSAELGVTVLLVTHDRQLSQAVDRVVAIRDGKTSSEFLRREAYREAYERDTVGGSEELFPEARETHDEFVLVDRAGRIQLPHQEMERLGITRRSRLRISSEENKLIVTKVENAEAPPPEADTAGERGDDVPAPDR